MDADPSRASSAAQAGDVISKLVGIYGSKELFISEYRCGVWGAREGGVAQRATDGGAGHRAARVSCTPGTGGPGLDGDNYAALEEPAVAHTRAHVRAHRSMLADRLLAKSDYDCDRELRTLELLKVAAGGKGAVQGKGCSFGSGARGVGGLGGQARVSAGWLMLAATLLACLDGPGCRCVLARAICITPRSCSR